MIYWCGVKWESNDFDHTLVAETNLSRVRIASSRETNSGNSVFFVSSIARTARACFHEQGRMVAKLCGTAARGSQGDVFANVLPQANPDLHPVHFVLERNCL